ncbi:hypothetical protein GN956_G2738 [Arapaima gigas]
MNRPAGSYWSPLNLQEEGGSPGLSCRMVDKPPRVAAEQRKEWRNAAVHTSARVTHTSSTLPSLSELTGKRSVLSWPAGLGREAVAPTRGFAQEPEAAVDGASCWLSLQIRDVSRDKKGNDTKQVFQDSSVSHASSRVLGVC